MVVAMCFSSPVCSSMTVHFAKGWLRLMLRIICKNLINVPDFPRKNFVILDRSLYKRPTGNWNWIICKTLCYTGPSSLQKAGQEGWNGSFAKTCCFTRPSYLRQPSPECWPAPITKKMAYHNVLFEAGWPRGMIQIICKKVVVLVFYLYNRQTFG